MGKYFLPFLLVIVFLIPSTKLISEENSPVKFSLSDTTDVLSALTARIKDQSIYINWRISNPTDISYFEVKRLNSKTKSYERINDVRIKKSDFTEKAIDENNRKILKYNFEDKPDKDGVYYYKLAGFNANGTVIFESDEIKIGVRFDDLH